MPSLRKKSIIKLKKLSFSLSKTKIMLRSKRLRVLPISKKLGKYYSFARGHLKTGYPAAVKTAFSTIHFYIITFFLRGGGEVKCCILLIISQSCGTATQHNKKRDYKKKLRRFTSKTQANQWVKTSWTYSFKAVYPTNLIPTPLVHY